MRRLLGYDMDMDMDGYVCLKGGHRGKGDGDRGLDEDGGGLRCCEYGGMGQVGEGLRGLRFEKEGSWPRGSLDEGNQGMGYQNAIDISMIALSRIIDHHML